MDGGYGDSDERGRSVSSMSDEVRGVVVNPWVAAEGVWHAMVVYEGWVFDVVTRDAAKSELLMGDINKIDKRDVLGVLYCPRVTGGERTQHRET